MKRFAVSVVILCLVLTPVSSFAGSKPVRVESTPEGATIYVDGKKVGVTPLVVEVDGRWWSDSNSKHEFIAEKAGYTPVTKAVTANQANMPAVIGSICLIPALWAAEIPDVVQFTLLPVAK
jgi:hypothetical protein